MTEAPHHQNLTILYADRHRDAGDSGYYDVFFVAPVCLNVELAAPTKPG